MSDINFEQLMDLLQLLIVIVALVLVYKSYPAGKIDQLLGQLAEPVAKSETKVDDVLLQVAELLHGLRRDTEPSNVPPKEPL